MGFFSKVLKVAGIAAAVGGAIYTGGASLGVMGAAAGASTAAGAVAAGMGAVGASVTAGATAAGALASGVGVGGLLSAASSIASTVQQAGSFISSVSNVAGAFAQPFSTYAGAQSSLYQAKQAATDYLTKADEFDYSAETSDLNASIAKRNLIYEEQRAFAQEEQMRRSLDKIESTAQVSYAASGVTADGSVGDVIRDISNEGMLQIALADFESRQRQTGFKTQEEQYVREAGQFRKAAGQSRTNAQTVLDEGYKTSKAQKGTAFAEGLMAIPDALNSVKQLASIFG